MELSNNGECGFVSACKNDCRDYLIKELSKSKEDRIIQPENCRKLVSKFDVSEQVKKFEEILEGIQ